jgi:hypothetical protein
LQFTRIPSSRIPTTTTTITKYESYSWIYDDPKTSQKQEAKEKKKKKNSLKFSCVEEQKLNFHGSHGFSKGSLQKVE